MPGTVLQVSVSRGGLPKKAVGGAFLTTLGFTGDSVAHPQFHGGPKRAILLVTSEGIGELIARGFPLFFGALGENITSHGLARHDLKLGTRLLVGEAAIELLSMRKPCAALHRYGASIKEAVYRKGMAPGDAEWGLGGFYCAVTREGWVRPDDIIQVDAQADAVDCR